MSKEDELKLGPTGEYPEGKLDEADDGELRISVGKVDDKVVMSFGTPVEWIGMTLAQALQIGQALIAKATGGSPCAMVTGGVATDEEPSN